ncbi:TPA: RNA 2',3'-cyclic phosphodiesterase [Clostridium botulinum]|uniref:RNA 2',3'-cyclic phosphodiesterase n=1 Tax=Clostridium TaxID=1485 RepID=UPI0007731F0B|nr:MULTISPECIES: RNA 2',3'-cyclic phosphodiesterase [Clostridium]AUM96609.1 2'-5' RNA ligase [Clostridium sporogenes]AVQ44511.1 RNA 2',3'-cyclic phosphodiesterase [Clostridium botulinum]AVQ48054.1 RNA 2',3'-cyclic phosphodiesterase [Clostridium botulinum]AVQ54060.1 RNA 2',3'-cyclic phosphodiesterase [Clostridium botulinum]NFG96143.1 RNA 2',3'-cyclic phosphodiesterase [Clostridium sporogenes]
MRVFYAVTFQEETKEKLIEYKNLVSNNSVKGRFTNKNNFHLTLEFIGEVDEKELSLLTNILYKLQNPPKELITSHIGSFKRRDKDIIWLGIEENKELITLQRNLRNLLINNGFKIENRKYKPHITIGREIVTKCPIEKNIFSPIKIPIASIALMESKRFNGQLVYEPLEEIII